MLKGAPAALALVPDQPGAVDDIVLGGLRILIKALVRLLESGKTAAEIVEHLEAMEPAARLDVDGEVERFANGDEK